MTEPPSNRPPRRIRYQGTHPRRFQDKYKEQQPEKYPDEIAHLIAKGKTPAGTHRPILLAEILRWLKPLPGQIAVDCTLGYGGHAAELLKAIQPGGTLIGVDADPIQLPKTEARLRELGYPSESLVVRRMNYAGVVTQILSITPDGADMVLADLGLSSMQIDDPARGFTFKADGPLDMRLNPEHGQPASALLTQLNAKELAQILDENADEPEAVSVAQAIIAAQSKQPLTTTTQLANFLNDFLRGRRQFTEDKVKETTRRVFQALRIAVNDEFGALDSFLRQLPSCLKPGGRAAILTFHSGEDRRVKRAFKTGLQMGLYSSTSDEVIRPSMEEQRSNPRSTSAKLRVAVRG